MWVHGFSVQVLQSAIPIPGSLFYDQRHIENVVNARVLLLLSEHKTTARTVVCWSPEGAVPTAIPQMFVCLPLGLLQLSARIRRLLRSGIVRTPSYAPSRLRHLLSQVKEQLTIGLAHLAQESAEQREQTRIFAGAAPQQISFGFAIRKIRELGWFFTIVEQLVERNF